VGAVVSAADLKLLADEKAFEPTQRFAELPADHVPREELGGYDIEAQVLETVTYEEPRVAVVWAPPGAGKSSVIATVGERLPPRFLLLPIPVWGLPDGTVTSASEFGRHILAQVNVLLSSHLQAHQRKKLGRALVTKRTRQSGGMGGSAALGLPIKGLETKIALELHTATQSIEEQVGVGNIYGGVESLRGIFEYQEIEPVFVIDDTDHWAGRGEEGIKIARAFFSNVLRPYAKNLDLRLLLAVHDHYRELEEYRAARDFLREFEVPALSPPAEALGRILAQRIDQSSCDASLREVFEDGAVDRLEAEYDRLERNLRKTLTIAYVALAKAGPPFPERITKDHIRDTARGQYPVTS
jgi:hypothetical protein